MGKLVRDFIPDMIRKSEKTPILASGFSNEEFQFLLNMKLKEEVTEYLESGFEKGYLTDKNLEELADILEVIHATLELHSVEFEDLDNIRLAKKEERGGFDKRQYWIGNI